MLAGSSANVYKKTVAHIESVMMVAPFNESGIMQQHSYHMLVCAKNTYCGYPMVTCSHSPVVNNCYCVYLFLIWRPIQSFYFVVF